MKTCIICGKEFASKSSNAICCSNECRRVRWNEMEKTRKVKKKSTKEPVVRRCNYCGKEFVSDRFRKYCCLACTKLAQDQRQRTKYWAEKEKLQKEYEPTAKENCPKDCQYLSGGSLPTCDYLLITGKPRPKVGGTVLECEVYKKGKKLNTGRWMLPGSIFPGNLYKKEGD